MIFRSVSEGDRYPQPQAIDIILHFTAAVSFLIALHHLLTLTRL